MRILSLDILRTVAVLLVFARHAHWPVSDCILERGGWIGVDLFFVLSGFLVSGLLFADHDAHGKIDWARFYIRRGFKIYPTFWALILFTVYVGATTRMSGVTWQSVLGELCFLQNYSGHALWGHTWSLAVEEHFYVLLPLLLIWLPHKRLPRFVLTVATVLLIGRSLNALTTFRLLTHLTPTHLRIDSLLFGTLLCYWYRYTPNFKAICAKHAGLLYATGLTLLTPAFIFPMESMCTLGYTTNYLGSGAILLAAVCRGIPVNRFTRTLATVGTFSYPIYIWHAPIFIWGFPQYTWLSVIAAPLLSIVFGIVWAKAIELPCLQLRDRLTTMKPTTLATS